MKRDSNKKKDSVKNNSMKGSFIKAFRSIYQNMTVLTSIIILIGISKALIPNELYSRFFSGTIYDLFIASGLGSVLAGNPVTSYIIGGELLKQGVALSTVTAFLISWVTVGIVQLPAEMIILGKRFAIARNITSFVISIFVALTTAWLMTIV